MARHIVSSDPEVYGHWYDNEDWDWGETAPATTVTIHPQAEIVPRRKKDYSHDVQVPEINELTAIVTKDFADVIVEASFYDQTDGWIVEEQLGSSWRSPEDDVDHQIGHDLAYWKAVQALATKNLRRLNNHVDMLAENKAHSEQVHRGE